MSGPLVDAAFGEFRERPIGRLFLVEHGLEEFNGGVITQGPSPRDQTAVRGDLVVLRALAAGNEARIERGFVEARLDSGATLLDDPGDPVAMLADRLLVDRSEHLFEL